MGKKVHPTQKTGRQSKPKASKKSNPGLLEKLKLTSVINTIRETDRNILLAGSLAAILLIIGTVSIVAGSGSTETSTANEAVVVLEEEVSIKTALISQVEGTLQAKDSDGQWADIAQGSTISEADALRTVGATSRSVVTFDNDTQLRLDANSEVYIESFTDERIVVHQLNGYTYNRVITSDQQYVIRTADAQYEALGTAFRASATGDEQSVEVFHDSVIETQSNTRASEGKKYTAKSNVDPSKDESLSDLDIEELKNDKFIQWNIALDRQNDLYKNDLGFLSDTEGPELSIISHQNGAVILLEPTANLGTIEIAGKTERGAKVTIENTTTTDNPKVEVTADSDGKFVSPVIQAAIGDVTFKISTRDRAGNETSLTLRVTFQRKSAAVVGETDGINLSITVDETAGELQAFWVLMGSLEAPDGYRLIYGTESTPEYPPSDDSKSKYIPTGENIAIMTSEFKEDEAYYFRICIYDAEDDECTTYSEQVSATPNES